MKIRQKLLRVRRLAVERLEDRMLLSVAPTAGFDPSPLEQELFEHLNHMRQDPQGELDTLFTSIDPLVARDPDADLAIGQFGDPTSLEIQNDWSSLGPVAPLAWDESLQTAALQHSGLMIDNDDQLHQFPGELSLGDRVEEAGYQNWSRVGENIYAYANSPFHADSAFVIDWGVPSRGHRLNIMDPSFQQAGIGILVDFDPDTDVGPLVVTQDFGSRADQTDSYLLGVVYDDADADGRYDAGEGLGGVTIEIEGSSGPLTVVSMTAGAYQSRVPAGTYTVRASGGELTSPIEITDVVIGPDNVKVDLLGSSASNAPPTVDLNGPGQSGIDFTASFDGTSGPVPIVAPGLTVDDPDSRNLVSATASISNLLDPGAELLSVDTGSTAIRADFDPLTGVLRLTGTDSRENYQQVLRSLQYDNAAFERIRAAKTVQITVNDGFQRSVPAVATIDFLPSLGIDSLVMAEGDYGQSGFVFTVNLSHAFDQPVAVDYVVGGGTAEAGLDYQAGGGRLRIDPGQTSATITATVLGDTVVEDDETFYVTLSNPSNARIAGGQAEGQIRDDDLPLELAAVELVKIAGLDPSSGRILYRLEASADGILTIEASFAGPQNALEMTLYDALRRETPLAVSTPAAGSGRIDWLTDRGTTYFLSLAGSADRVDLTLGNLVRQDGPAVSVRGTDGDDDFQFDASDGPQFAINGLHYDFDPAAVQRVTFDAGQGDDTVVLHDSEQDDTLLGRPGSVTFSGGGLSFQADGFETLYAYATAGGTDTASLYDSSLDDKFRAYPTYAKLYSDGSYQRVKYFDYVHAYATQGGDDEARFYDSPQPDKFKATPVYAKLYNGSYQNRAKFFEKVIAYASSGDDLARLFDSAADDQAVGTSEKARLRSDAVPFDVTARRFREAILYSNAGGHDVAELYDGIAADVFRGLPHKSEFFDAATGGEVQHLTVREFEEVHAYATADGFDTAKLYPLDSGGLFEEGEGWAKLSGLGYLVEVVGFELVRQIETTDTPILSSGNEFDPLLFGADGQP